VTAGRIDEVNDKTVRIMELPPQCCFNAGLTLVGRYWNAVKVRITELPVGRWTEDYKTLLESLPGVKVLCSILGILSIYGNN